MKPNGCGNIWCSNFSNDSKLNCILHGIDDFKEVSQCDTRKKYKKLIDRIGKRIRRFDRNDIVRLYDEEMYSMIKESPFNLKWRKNTLTRAAEPNKIGENLQYLTSESKP